MTSTSTAPRSRRCPSHGSDRGRAAPPRPPRAPRTPPRPSGSARPSAPRAAATGVADPARIAAAALTIRAMPALIDAALDAQERELLDRLITALVEEYAADLDAVWLYGSRARGERPHDESGIDVLVITRSERDDEGLIPTLRRGFAGCGRPRHTLGAPRRAGPPPDLRPRQAAFARVAGGSADDWLILPARRRPRQD